MERIPRFYDNLLDYGTENKVLVLYGPRQVGKTTLVKRVLQASGKKVKYASGDDYRIQEVWDSRNLDLLRDYAAGYDIVAVDEAQRIPGIGLGLKLLIDSGSPTRFVVTGSSSFGLSGRLGEPLTGRKVTLTLFPPAQLELKTRFNDFELKERLEDFLIYGSYPEVLTTEPKAGKIALLDELVGSYLLKDIMELERVKSAKILLDLLRLLAFQVGNEVSLRELGAGLGLDYKTVARYLDLLEKSFILFNIRGYSGNLRNEVVKKSKYYFYDTGIRNAVIANFNGLGRRDDTGGLWENFLFIERLKKRSYERIPSNTFFWRTWNKQEIDYLEERDGKLFGYEMKWGKKIPSAPAAWKEAYPQAEYEVINRDNYLGFIL